MEYFPVCLKLQDAPALLVGAGSVALRKARLLLRAGARLTVVAPEACDELVALLQEEGGEWLQRPYAGADLDGATLVIAATSDPAVNRQVHDDATARRLPVNVVDSPELCSFIVPAIVDRSPLIIAISSSGASPVLARLWRRRIEALIPAAYGRLAQWARGMRDRVKNAIPEESLRRLFWEQAIEGRVGELVLAQRETEAEGLLDAQLADQYGLQQGEVYLIGAGPGDPDLMTFKALRLLQRADVVLYDALVNPRIVELGRRDAERIYVGKRRAEHAMSQQQISQALVDLAQAGKRVVRLKGGDPFIFGRGGEEIGLLARHKVPFQVVPGITAASGAAAYAGIPLTHRDYAQSVRFITGHTKNGELHHDWSQFLLPTETLVFYMSLVGLPIICEQLIAHGRDPETPVALVGKASTPEQRVLVGTLATMVEIVEREQPERPTLTIVGEVVRLHQSLAWFGEGAKAGG